jgi:RNA polymerase sigma factor (sigma-70 family)
VAELGDRRTADPLESAAEDAALLMAWADGDQAAGRQLFARCIGPLYRFFCNKVDTGIEDLIQDTLLTSLTARKNLRSEADFRTFLFGIARHKLYKRWRAMAGPRGRVDFATTSLAALQSTPSHAVARAQSQAMLLTALRELPAELQVALELYYWEELSAGEIAEVLEVPEGTVRSRLRRAKQLLQASLAGRVDLPQGADAERELDAKVRRLRSVLAPDAESA